MDFIPFIPHFMPTLTWLIPPIVLLVLLNSPWAKGHIGEWQVRLFAGWRLDKSTYRSVHNVTLDTPDGTTQIDHVFISTFGIFVLETKNMRGWIFGTPDQTQWTQKLYRRTFKFQNPLRQNYKHLKALEATLGVAPERLHSVISFVGGSRFKTQMPVNVTEGMGFIRYIRSFRQPVFSEAEVEVLLKILHDGRRAPSRATHREHLHNLKQRHDPNARRQCPKCGNSLVIRTRKTGEKVGQPFWGCSAYPKCRITQAL
jgi:hypothetical protein